MLIIKSVSNMINIIYLFIYLQEMRELFTLKENRSADQAKFECLSH